MMLQRQLPLLLKVHKTDTKNTDPDLGFLNILHNPKYHSAY